MANTFRSRLQPIMQEADFLSFKYNMCRYQGMKLPDGTLQDEFIETLILLRSLDGHQADGHFLSKDRTSHSLKIVGWDYGIEGSFSILMNFLQTSCRENDYWGFYDVIEEEILDIKHTIAFEQDVIQQKLNFDIVFGTDFDLAAGQRD